MSEIKAYEDLLAGLLAKAGEWREEDHPRDDNGKFTTAGGGASAAPVAGAEGANPDSEPAHVSSRLDGDELQNLADRYDDKLTLAMSSLPSSLPDEVYESLSEYAGIAINGITSRSQSDWTAGIAGMAESIVQAMNDGDIGPKAGQRVINRIEKVRDSLTFRGGKSDEQSVATKLEVFDKIEFKELAVTNTAEMEFEGYGAIFGNVDSHGDIIEPGAFKDSLTKASTDESHWPVMLLQHGGKSGSARDATPIGAWTELREDRNGLYVKGKLVNTERGREVYELLRMKPRPGISGLSIGYIVRDSSPAPASTKARRLLKSVDLAEVSMVTFPSNSRSRVLNTKSVPFSERELERKLTRDAGLTRSQAQTLMKSGAGELLVTRDADGEKT